MFFVGSPRARRRLAKVAVAAVACVAAVLVVVLFPNTNGKQKQRFTDEPVQRVVIERSVPVTPARRAAVNALFDSFVPKAVERKDPAAAYDLVTPAFRGDGTRASWRRGDLPVFFYEPRGRTFHGWTVDTSYRDSMSLQLYLLPRHKKDGPVAYSVDLVREHGKWLINSFYPRTSYAPIAAAGKRSAKSNAKAADPADSALPQGKGSVMWILIAAFLALVVAFPLGFFVVHGLSSRRSRRRLEAELRR